MSVIQNINLDVNQISMFSFINTKQGDSGRVLRVRITINGKPHNITKNSTVVFRAIKPDDTIIYNSGTINSDGTCDIELTSSTLSVPGKILADISILYNNVSVSSASFVIFNDKFPRSSSSITSTDEVNALSAFVSQLSSYNATLTNFEDNKMYGPGITASLDDGILTVTKIS